jgi:redox-sensitive bicupin YhaK (pirin superfamily)
MTAGRGIVHSERTGKDARQHSSRLFGIQSWLAQPKACEEGAPAFTHVKETAFPTFETRLLSGRLLLGEFEGYVSPIESQWETLYLEVRMKKGGELEIPGRTEERAIYLVSGNLEIAGRMFGSRQMMVLRPGHEILVTASEDLHLLVLGGAAMDGPRYIWWNFVSSSVERIQSAARDWENKKFDIVPGDEKEFIPLSDQPFPEI